MNGSKIMLAHRWRLINERLENNPLRIDNVEGLLLGVHMHGSSKWICLSGEGNTCVLEMGTMDSYPKRFMAAIAPSVLRGVTVELRFKSNQKLTKIQSLGGSVVDTSFDWYGVEKLKELYTLIP